MIVFESSCLVFTGADGSVVATFHGAFVDWLLLQYDLSIVDI
jgi:hypothetical protein